MTRNTSIALAVLAAGLAVAGAIVGREGVGTDQGGNQVPGAVDQGTEPQIAVDTLVHANTSRTEAPIAVPPTILSRPFDARARRVYLLLRDGLNQQSCSGEVQADLDGLLDEAKADPETWAWALENAAKCAEVLQQPDRVAKMLTEGVRTQPENFRVWELMGERNLAAGAPDEAISTLQQALKLKETYQARELLGEAHLMLAARFDAEGSKERASDAYQAAAASVEKALATATPAMRPFLMVKMARVQLGLGQTEKASEWSRQAEESVRSLDSARQARLIPSLYLRLGSIFYNAGQRQTSLAYMDQAIGMATSDTERRQFESIKQGFVDGRS